MLVGIANIYEGIDQQTLDDVLLVPQLMRKLLLRPTELPISLLSCIFNNECVVIMFYDSSYLLFCEGKKVIILNIHTTEQ